MAGYRTSISPAQKVLLGTNHAEHLPGQLREGEDFKGLDAYVRDPSPLAARDRLFEFLWKEFGDEGEIKEAVQAIVELKGELDDIVAALLQSMPKATSPTHDNAVFREQAEIAAKLYGPKKEDRLLNTSHIQDEPSPPGRRR